MEINDEDVTDLLIALEFLRNHISNDLILLQEDEYLRSAMINNMDNLLNKLSR
jgi:hypothetical protein